MIVVDLNRKLNVKLIVRYQKTVQQQVREYVRNKGTEEGCLLYRELLRMYTRTCEQSFLRDDGELERCSMYVDICILEVCERCFR